MKRVNRSVFARQIPTGLTECVMKKGQPLSSRRLFVFSLIIALALAVFSVSMRRGRADGFTSLVKMWMSGAPQKVSGPLAGPVSVTATAGTTGPTDYATLKLAFDAINAGTHQGVITIIIVGDTTETAPAVLNASGSGAAS